MDALYNNYKNIEIFMVKYRKFVLKSKFIDVFDAFVDQIRIDGFIKQQATDPKQNNKLIWVNSSLKKYINVILPKLFFNTSGVYHLEKYEEKITVKKLSEYVYEGTKCAKIDIKANRKLDKLGEILKEQQIGYNKVALEYIDNAIKEKECYSLNDLEEGQQYTIIGFTKKLNGKKEKYLLKLLEKGDNIYVSNSFLEDKIKENGIIENRTLIKIGIIKTDKNKRKQRTIYY